MITQHIAQRPLCHILQRQIFAFWTRKRWQKGGSGLSPTHSNTYFFLLHLKSNKTKTSYATKRRKVAEVAFIRSCFYTGSGFGLVLYTCLFLLLFSFSMWWSLFSYSPIHHPLRHPGPTIPPQTCKPISLIDFMPVLSSGAATVNKCCLSAVTAIY